MAGSYSRSTGAPRNLSANYANANSLAITPASLQGKWASTDGSIRLEFDPSGLLIAGTTSGTSFGTCQLSTTLVQSEPGTSKNMFHLTLTAQNVAAGLDTPCKLDTASPYNGLAAIVLEPAGTLVSDGYFRTIAFNAISDGYMLTGYLRKEP
jgi:hypothetical protein